MNKELLTQYYTKEHLQMISECKDYEDMVSVALEILRDIPKPLAQVCGPVSTGGKGSIEKNLQRLENAMLKLVAQGINVFNQASFEEPMQKIRQEKGTNMDESNLELLEQFYKPLFESGLINTLYFLPDWQSSFGATWERKQAERLGITIIDLPDDF
jgi:hypothetical protein